MRQIDESWEKLNSKLGLLVKIEQSGFVEITASEINSIIGNPDARNLVSFNRRREMPILFQENECSILSIRRGTYVIGKFDVFADIPEGEYDTGPLTDIRIPEHLESLHPDLIRNESSAISLAYATKALGNFLEEPWIEPTISGRQGGGVFSFKIKSSVGADPLEIEVKKPQIEIDAGFEGESLSLIEGKIGLPETFNLRQLYYPYRNWSKAISKPVRPIVLFYSEGVFYIFEYEFTDDNIFNSARLIRKMRYMFGDSEIEMEDIIGIHKEVSTVPDDPDIPFPQANSLEKILRLCSFLKCSPKNVDEIAEEFGFEGRQSDYYANAGRYLGLIKKDSRGRPWQLSKRGQKLLTLSPKQMRLSLCRYMFEHVVIYKCFEVLRNEGSPPSKEYVANLIEANTNLSGGTPVRRADTILAWVHWISHLSNR